RPRGQEKRVDVFVLRGRVRRDLNVTRFQTYDLPISYRHRARARSSIRTGRGKMNETRGRAPRGVGGKMNETRRRAPRGVVRVVEIGRASCRERVEHREGRVAER